MEKLNSSLKSGLPELTGDESSLILTGDENSLSRLAELLTHEISRLREIPEAVNLYSSRNGDEKQLEYLSNQLSIRLSQALQDKQKPRISTSKRFDSHYSFDLGYFLDHERMPAIMDANPNGKEDYFPQPKKDEKRIIAYIVSGTVIDHIPRGRVWKLIDPLGLNEEGYLGRVSVGDNYDSQPPKDEPHKTIKKGILKIENRFLTPRELDIVSVYAPTSKVSTISAGKVTRKQIVSVPRRLEGLFMCADSNCSNDVLLHNQGRYTCSNCERDYSADEIRYKK